MISPIGRQAYTQGASRIQKAEAPPTEGRPRPTNTREPATQSAAVVRIGNDARVLASQSEQVARSGVRSESEQRAEISIEPVVAQPVPDFNASRPGTTESTSKSSSGFRAPPTGYQGVA